MFDNSQAAADVLKGMVGRKNKRALIAVQRLEQCGWSWRAFDEAMAKEGARYDENGFSFSVDIGYAVEMLIDTYLALVGCQESDPFVDIFDTREAAEYLGISYDMMKTYVSREKRIRGKAIGKSMIFARHQLDKFKREMRPVGNPSKVEE